MRNIVHRIERDWSCFRKFSLDREYTVESEKGTDGVSTTSIPRTTGRAMSMVASAVKVFMIEYLDQIRKVAVGDGMRRSTQHAFIMAYSSCLPADERTQGGDQ